MTTTIPVEGQTRDLLRALASRALDQADGDRAVGRDLLIGMISDEPKVRDALLAHVIFTASEAAIGAVLKDRRSRAWTAPVAFVSSKDPTQRMAAFGLANASRLLDYPMKDGTPLGRATGAQVRETFDHYDAQARTMAIKAAWLRAVAEKVEPEQIVADVLDEDAVQALRQKAEG